jgi:hypothetical protein
MTEDLIWKINFSPHTKFGSHYFKVVGFIPTRAGVPLFRIRDLRFCLMSVAQINATGTASLLGNVNEYFGEHRGLPIR